MKTTSEAKSFLEGKITEANYDDLRAERDKILELVQNLDLNTKDYRRSVQALTTARKAIQKIKSGNNINPLSYALNAFLDFTFDRSQFGK